MSKHCRFLSLVVLLGISLRSAAAGSLVKIWELNLSNWNNAAWGVAKTFPVAALSFSPDGKRIALTATETKKEDGQLSGLLLVARIGAPDGDVKSFEAPRGEILDWSPSGDAIMVSSLLIKVETGASCSLPNIARFISNDQLLGQRRAAPHSGATEFTITPPSRPTQFTIFDKDCRPGKEWGSTEEWYIRDVSIERRLVLMNRPFKENLLVDPDDGRVVRSWPVGTWPRWDGPGGEFADDGTALCSPVPIDDEDKRSNLRCWKTDSGELIGHAPADHASSPFAVSLRSTRVIYSEYGYIKGLIPDLDSHPYKDAAVWDYATGEKLASWRPKTQSWMELGLRPPKKIVQPSKFTISPDGQFIAEAGNGKLTVYRVQQ
jgi:WD40 repeat protein